MNDETPQPHFKNSLEKKATLRSLLSMKMGLLQKSLLLVTLVVLLVTGIFWIAINFKLGGPFESYKGEIIKLHGSFGFVFAVLFGGLWLHIKLGLLTQQNQKSGMLLAAVSLFLIVSACFLYYSGSDVLRTFMSNAHSIAGLMLPIALLIHLRKKFYKRAKS